MGPSRKALGVAGGKGWVPTVICEYRAPPHCCWSLRTEIKGASREGLVFGPAFPAVSRCGSQVSSLMPHGAVSFEGLH